MTETMEEELARQVARLLEEAERPMRVEEILPHLDPIVPSPNDVADTLSRLASKKEVSREGSFFSKPTPVPIDTLFRTTAQRDAARVVVDLVRALDADSAGDGAQERAVLKAAGARGISVSRAIDAMAVLRNAGEVYSVGSDRVRLAKP